MVSNLSDLMRIEEVGETEAILLENLGVDTVKELARRNPTNLYNRTKDYAELYKIDYKIVAKNNSIFEIFFTIFSFTL